MRKIIFLIIAIALLVAMFITKTANVFNVGVFVLLIFDLSMDVFKKSA